MGLFGCSFCISQAGTEWRGPALLLALGGAACGIAIAVAARRASGQVRLGLVLVAVALVVVLPAAVVAARAGRTVVVLDPRYGIHDGEAWRVTCAGGFPPSANTDNSTTPDLDRAVDDACAAATLGSRNATLGAGALGLGLLVVGTVVALTGRGRTSNGVGAAPGTALG